MPIKVLIKYLRNRKLKVEPLNQYQQKQYPADFIDKIYKFALEILSLEQIYEFPTA
jgi:hypothetical protein